MDSLTERDLMKTGKDILIMVDYASDTDEFLILMANEALFYNVLSSIVYRDGWRIY
ncbi:hypothetical protein FACS1894122_03790 [Alphaproteobacteria bacterium]|nr:hypothetical protein FACS1894122_03790 [Alphaproteobacteria bacterium]